MIAPLYPVEHASRAMRYANAVATAVMLLLDTSMHREDSNRLITALVELTKVLTDGGMIAMEPIVELDEIMRRNVNRGFGD